MNEGASTTMSGPPGFAVWLLLYVAMIVLDAAVIVAW